MQSLFTIILLNATLDQSYFNVTTGAAFFAATVAILCFCVDRIIVNKRKQQMIIDELEKRINLRQKILSNSSTHVWRSDGNTIELTQDFAEESGFPCRLSVHDVVEYIHQQSKEQLHSLQDYYTESGRRNLRILIRTPKNKTWQWYNFTFDVDTSNNTKYRFKGIFSCVNDDVDLISREHKIGQKLKECQQTSFIVQELLPALRRLHDQFLGSTNNFISLDIEKDKETMIAENDQIQSSGKAFIEMTTNIAEKIV